MYGSILYNCWSALFGFTVYFVLTIQNPFAAPIVTIISSVIAAIIAFVLMFPIRYLLNFILYTPQPVELEIESTVQQQTEQVVDDQTLLNETNTVEFEDDNTEDIAKVVRTMMYEDDEQQTAS